MGKKVGRGSRPAFTREKGFSKNAFTAVVVCLASFSSAPTWALPLDCVSRVIGATCNLYGSVFDNTFMGTCAANGATPYCRPDDQISCKGRCLNDLAYGYDPPGGQSCTTTDGKAGQCACGTKAAKYDDAVCNPVSPKPCNIASTVAGSADAPSGMVCDYDCVGAGGPGLPITQTVTSGTCTSGGFNPGTCTVSFAPVSCTIVATPSPSPSPAGCDQYTYASAADPIQCTYRKLLAGGGYGATCKVITYTDKNCSQHIADLDVWSACHDFGDSEPDFLSCKHVTGGSPASPSPSPVPSPSSTDCNIQPTDNHIAYLASGCTCQSGFKPGYTSNPAAIPVGPVQIAMDFNVLRETEPRLAADLFRSDRALARALEELVYRDPIWSRDLKGLFAPNVSGWSLHEI